MSVAPPAVAARPDRATRVFLWIVLPVAVVLRGWRYPDLLPWLDEIWSLKVATEHPASWIFTHFHTYDACIPLTLYVRGLLSTIGVSEWSLRLPEVLSGGLTCWLVAWVGARCLPRPQAWLLTGAVATSPYLVYLAREARPYAVTMFLFPLATALVVAWTRGRPRSALIAAAVCGVLCVWFHAVTGLSVGILCVYAVLCTARRPALRSRWRDLAVAAAVLVVLAVALIVPALASFQEFMRASVLQPSPAVADATTVRRGLTLLAGAPVVVPAWLWLAVAFAGLGWLRQRHAAEASLGAALIIAQVVVIFRLQSFYLGASWTWLRYHGHLLPLFATFLACGLLAPLDLLGPRLRERAGAALAALAAGAALAYHGAAGHYSIGEASAYNANPFLVFVQNDGAFPARFAAVRSPFYETVLPGLAPGALIEAPVSVFLPHYGVYQRWHGRRVLSGALAAGWSGLFEDPRLRLRTVVPLDDRARLSGSGARYLLLHKRAHLEFLRMWEAMSAQPGPAAQVVPPPPFLGYHTQIEFGPRAPVLPFPASPVYEDEGLAVYDLTALDPPAAR